MIISPSLLAADFMNLAKEVKSFDNAKNISFHLDVMDGHYVPNLTFGKSVLKNLKQSTEHPLDCHLMVTNPEFYIKDFEDLGLSNISFHWEACTHHDSLIDLAKKIYPSVGIALNPATNVNIIPEYLLQKLDLILIMSVNPGFGGQSFIHSSIDKVKYLNQLKKKNGYHFSIQVDGGVNDTNAKTLKESGADILVAGSYIFNEESENYYKQVNKLRD